MATLNVLIIGDIVGRAGRNALKAKLPEMKEKYQPDLVIANGENLAHGYGVSEKILDDLEENGVDFFTSGNHIFKTGKDLNKILLDHPIIRPANYEDNMPGVGYKMIEVGTTKVLIINLLGQVFLEERIEETINNPFKVLDAILAETKMDKPDIVLIDFHAEATSEKKSLGAFVDGRASLMFGTHTHIQTADEYIMPEGTGYITDIGMVGVQHSSLGMEFDSIIKSFVSETKLPKIVPQHGLCLINGIIAKIDIGTGKTVSIERVTEYAEV